MDFSEAATRTNELRLLLDFIANNISDKLTVTKLLRYIEDRQKDMEVKTSQYEKDLRARYGALTSNLGR